MTRLDWLTARPVAHRGLHDRKAGVIENTPSAFAAAIAANYAIECDLQLSADGEAMVFHDHDLDRLTQGSGPVVARTAAELRRIAFKDSPDHMPTLAELCAMAGGGVPLLLELKSTFDGDLRLPLRVAEILRGYDGKAAVMSFDPDQIAALAAHAPGLPRGIVAERHFNDPEAAHLGSFARARLGCLLHARRSRPHFIAYRVDDLPAPAPWIARHLFKLPLLAWTVRTKEQRMRAARFADQMIFEGFRP